MLLFPSAQVSAHLHSHLVVLAEQEEVNRCRDLLELLPTSFTWRCTPRSSLCPMLRAMLVPWSRRIGATPCSPRTSWDGFIHVVKCSQAHPDHWWEPFACYSQVSFGLHHQCRVRSQLLGKHPEFLHLLGAGKHLGFTPPEPQPLA